MRTTELEWEKLAPWQKRQMVIFTRTLALLLNMEAEKDGLDKRWYNRPEGIEVMSAEKFKTLPPPQPSPNDPLAIGLKDPHEKSGAEHTLLCLKCFFKKFSTANNSSVDELQARRKEFQSGKLMIITVLEFHGEDLEEGFSLTPELRCYNCGKFILPPQGAN